MIQRRTYIRRSALKPYRPKKRSKDDERYLAWIRSWPCWICLRKMCKEYGVEFDEAVANPGVRDMFARKTRRSCGITDAAHIGHRGIAQKCPNRETMPLGSKHHRRPLMGGGPEAHHVLGRHFWLFHDEDRLGVIAKLNAIFEKECG